VLFRFPPFVLLSSNRTSCRSQDALGFDIHFSLNSHHIPFDIQQLSLHLFTIFTMFSTRTTVFMALAVFFVGQVLASPLPQQAINAREVPLDLISAYVKRAPQAVNTMPEQTPTKGSPNGITPYKRAPQAVNTIPEQTPTKGSSSGPIAYKRVAQAVNTMPEQTPTKGSPNGIVIYKRQIPRRMEMSTSDVN
jgi:hypothetical protein